MLDCDQRGGNNQEAQGPGIRVSCGRELSDYQARPYPEGDIHAGLRGGEGTHWSRCPQKSPVDEGNTRTKAPETRRCLSTEGIKGKQGKENQITQSFLHVCLFTQHTFMEHVLYVLFHDVLTCLER